MGAHLEDTITQFLETLEPARKRPHFEVADMMDKVEPIFSQLGKAKLPYGAISAISEKTKLNYETLRDWRTKLLKNPEWRPYRDRNRGKQSLSPELEAILADKIRRDYIQQGEFHCNIISLSALSVIYCSWFSDMFTVAKISAIFSFISRSDFFSYL